jgi:hypothetical protein
MGVDILAQVPTFVPKQEVVSWADNFMKNFLRYTPEGLERELNYWRNLSHDDIERNYEKFHHTEIYAWGIHFGMLPAALRPRVSDARDPVSLNANEKRMLEDYYFNNKDKFVMKVEGYVRNNGGENLLPQK